MKKLLIALASILPFSSQAQKLEVVVQGGMAVHTPVLDNSTAVPGYAASAKAALHIKKKLMLAFAIDVHSMKEKTEREYVDPSKNEKLGNEVNFGAPQIVVSAAANYKMTMGNLMAYAGVAVGYSMTRTNSKFTPQLVMETGKGPMAGVQAGVAAKLSPRISVNAELSPRYYAMTYKGDHGNFEEKTKKDVIVVPVMVGVRIGIL